MIKQLRCPNCGARLAPPAGQPLVTCGYCHTTSQVGAPRAPAQPHQPQQPQYPVVRYQYPRWIWAIYVAPVVLGLVISGVAAIVNRGPNGGAAQGAASAKGSEGSSMTVQWWNRVPMPADVDGDGDGADEVVGWVSVRRGSEVRAHFAAYAVKSGRRLWMTGAIGTLSEASDSRAAVAGAVAIVVNAKGSAQAFSLRDGGAAWSVPLGERAESICLADDEHVIIATRDKKRHRINLADGALAPAKKSDRCRPTWTDASPPGHWFVENFDKAIGDEANLEPEGMEVDHVLAALDRKVLLALGYKRPGTRVPMAAAYRCDELEVGEGFHSGQLEYRCRGPKELWRGPVPEGDPLEASEGRPDAAAIGKERVFIAYEVERPHLAVFELESGRRLWGWKDESDRPGIHRIQFVLPVGEHLLMSENTGSLRVMEASSGELVGGLGDSN